MFMIGRVTRHDFHNYHFHANNDLGGTSHVVRLIRRHLPPSTATSAGKVVFTTIIRWRRGVAVERRIRDREVAGSGLGRALRRKNSGQVSHTYG